MKEKIRALKGRINKYIHFPFWLPTILVWIAAPVAFLAQDNKIANIFNMIIEIAGGISIGYLMNDLLEKQRSRLEKIRLLLPLVFIIIPIITFVIFEFYSVTKITGIGITGNNSDWLPYEIQDFNNSTGRYNRISAKLKIDQSMSNTYRGENYNTSNRYQEIMDIMNGRHDSYKSSDIDIFEVDTVWIASLSSLGYISPLTELYANQDIIKGDDFGIIQRANVFKTDRDDLAEIYAVPMFIDVGILVYDSKYIQKLPDSWEALVAAMKAVKQRTGKYGLVFQGGPYEGLLCFFFELLWSADGDAPVRKAGTILIDTPETAKVLRFMRDLIYVHGVVPEEVLSMDENKSLEFFKAGKAVVLRNWPYSYGHLTQKSAKFGLRVRAGTMLKFRDSYIKNPPSCLGGWNLAINVNSENREAAWKFIEYLLQPSVMRSRCYEKTAGRELTTGKSVPLRLPPSKTVFTELLGPEFKLPGEIMEKFNWRSRPITPLYMKISGILSKEFHRYLKEGGDVNKLLGVCQEEIDGLAKK